MSGTPQVSPGVNEITIEVGQVPILLRTSDAGFARMLRARYTPFVDSAAALPAFRFDIDLVRPGEGPAEEDLLVRRSGREWHVRRGDFQARWDMDLRRGWIRQSDNPYSIDSALRIVHTLALAGAGGFLVHASSAVRSGRGFLFAGRSGAGKTTLAGLAPPEATLLTDEISYVRGENGRYRLFGTPFTGELGRNGANISAPVAAIYFPVHGAANKLDRIGAPEAARRLLENILFFAEDGELVKLVFEDACDFARAVPAYELTFVPDAGVWDLIQ